MAKNQTRIKANDKRRNAINTRAKLKRIHRDIKRKLHAVDQKWNQSADTMGPCETHLTIHMEKLRNWRLVPLANGAMMCTL
jgi:hypothetical protein